MASGLSPQRLSPTSPCPLCSKNLTWRDMQHLVVQTSKPAHLNANDWATNGVGRKGEDRVAQRAGWAWGPLPPS